MRTIDLLQVMRDYFVTYPVVSFKTVKHHLNTNNVIKLCDECAKQQFECDSFCINCKRYYRFILMFCHTLCYVNIEADLHCIDHDVEMDGEKMIIKERNNAEER